MDGFHENPDCIHLFNLWSFYETHTASYVVWYHVWRWSCVDVQKGKGPALKAPGCPRSPLSLFSHSVGCDSLERHGLQPTRLLCPWDFPGPEYWSGLPFHFPEDLPDPGIEPASPALVDGVLYHWAIWEAPIPLVLVSISSPFDDHTFISSWGTPPPISYPRGFGGKDWSPPLAPGLRRWARCSPLE